MINTNGKGKSDENSKIEQLGTDQTSNNENGESNDDNIPLNKLKLYKHHHSTKNK